MTLSPRNKVILTIVGCVIAIAVLAVALMLPMYNELGKLDTQISTADQQAAVFKAKLAQRQQMKDQSASTNATWLQLTSAVPESANLPSLIIDLQDAAFASGVQLVALTPSAPTSPTAAAGGVQATTSAYLIIPVQLEIIGTWSDTVDYLQRIQKLTRSLRITEFTSTVSDNDTQAKKANATLPDYFEATSIKIEVYMISASATGK
ncbi:MAG: type 4a pilus biogenesis protein PilO [Coriobacteriia bacterium]|nr:type 4a pilus biogenesis protein PilO [Coriobacteriia bacterium]